MYTLLLRMTDTMISQNIELSSWDMLCIYIYIYIYVYICLCLIFDFKFRETVP
jgi:hypothetical protein